MFLFVKGVYILPIKTERNLLFKLTNEIRPLRVDYAKSNDDLKEYETQQRQGYISNTKTRVYQ